MVQRGGGNKSTGAKQVPINDYSQNPRMATNNKNDYDQKILIRTSKDDRQQYQQLPLARTTTQ